MQFAQPMILSVREQIADTVREQSLADRFGVSRGPIRDVLMQLSQEGVLVYQHNKGVKVGSAPKESERQLLQLMRRQMETYCLGQCMENLTPNDDQMLDVILAELSRACDSGDFGLIAQRDLALHRFLIRRSSKELETVWQSITSRLFMDYSRIQDLSEVVAEHQAIVNAIHDRDLPKAEAALNANII
jgi:DNA-binding GntR family transcriptional regulator